MQLDKSIMLPHDFVLGFQASRPELFPRRALTPEESVAIIDALQVYHETLYAREQKIQVTLNLINQLLSVLTHQESILGNIRDTLLREIREAQEIIKEKDDDDSNE